MIEVRMQTPPMMSGRLIRLVSCSVVPATSKAISTMVAPTVTTYVSNRSAAMPAQSPTLSPPLSEMTAGLRDREGGVSGKSGAVRVVRGGGGHIEKKKYE